MGYVFLVLVVLALWAAIGITVNLPMLYSRYQRPGIAISLLGILANIFWLALGPAVGKIGDASKVMNCAPNGTLFEYIATT